MNQAPEQQHTTREQERERSRSKKKKGGEVIRHFNIGLSTLFLYSVPAPSHKRL